ncbi:hypothetical protein [Streptomyces sp. NPDC048639]|uniref:hypothetical protein n=1 Tax=Streptomyces sp. NPDC048639 TaxID=3365581 RepID=UPI00371BA9D5
MQVQRIATATAVALAVGGLASLGAGSAWADGPGATAGGGSAAMGGLGQENTAQDGRQNNNCVRTNGGRTTVDGGRVDGRCVTADGSLNAFAHVKRGGTDAAGGDGPLQVAQQNTAQRGRQNNNCASGGTGGSTVTASGGGMESRCADRDFSSSEHTTVEGEGAAVSGAPAGVAFQQNVAQAGRQNTTCASQDASAALLQGGRTLSRCGNQDTSRSRFTTTRGGGAETNGATSGGLLVGQSWAQEGRQNVNCDNAATGGVDLMGGRTESSCGNADDSRSHTTAVKGSGAEVNGGNGPVAAFAQDASQEGRQNVHCANLNASAHRPSGGRVENSCHNADESRSHRTVTENGGAGASGGSSADAIYHRNVAQEGRQNTHCGDINRGVLNVSGGAADNRCDTTDRSLSQDTVTQGGGAEVDGGSGMAMSVQQNTAQEGRQNNSCGNSNRTDATLRGSHTTSECLADDRSTSTGTRYL